MPKPQQTDQPCAGFVFLVDTWRLCDTFRIRLTNEVEEMNKQELIDKAVHEFGGKWPSVFNMPTRRTAIDGFYITDCGTMTHKDHCEWFKDREFQQRSKELGYINGYRWGVEYPTNGKKPDFPGDVKISYKNTYYGDAWLDNALAVENLYFESEPGTYPVTSFKITDQHYKPSDTSYLVSEIPESKSNAENVSDWYDYEAREMKTLPDNNADVELLMGGVYQCRVEYIGVRSFKVVFYRYDTHEIDHAELPTASFRPLDHNRKAEAEKKRVVDAAIKACDKAREDKGLLQAFNELYDAGFLRKPSE
jgi:hypothetical protein